MGKGMRKSNTKRKGKRLSIYLDAESLERFEKIQKLWNMEGKPSETMQTIFEFWDKMTTFLNVNGLGRLVNDILKANEKKKGR